MDHQFHKIRHLPPNIFAEVNTMKVHTRVEGENIIVFDIVNPDQQLAPHIIEKLQETDLDTKVDQYSNSCGILGLGKAQTVYYERRFNLAGHGDSHSRFGLVENVQRISQAIRKY